MSEVVDRRFFGLLWQSFLKVNGWVLGVGGGMISWGAWMWGAGNAVPLPIVAGGACVLLLVIIVLGQAYYTAHQGMLRALPSVLRVERPGTHHRTGAAILLLEPSEHFVQALTVSVYVYRSDFEACVGVGRVLIVQEDGRVQVLLEHVYDGEKDVIAQWFGNNIDVLKAIRVRPTVRAHDLDNLPASKGSLVSSTFTTPTSPP